MPISGRALGSISTVLRMNRLNTRHSLWQTARQLIAAIGLASIMAAELMRGSAAATTLAVTAASAFVVSGLMLWREGRRTSTPPADTPLPPAGTSGPLAWRLVLLGLGALGVAVCQTWFIGGATIAGGDITPPVGTAWISQLFASFGWSGNNLGGPASGPLALPWAAVTELIHATGGSTALADRFFISLLIGGTLIAAGGFFRALGFTPLAGGVAAIVYFFNPYTLTEVGVNTVFLAAMLLVPLYCGATLAWAKGTWQWWQVIVIFAVGTPLIGYAFENPPLVGMVIAATVSAVFLSHVRWGRSAAKRALKIVFVGALVALAASADWIVPSKAALSSVATHRLSSLVWWNFTQLRATLSNDFWLNAVWGWHQRIYFPFAGGFSQFPLVIVRAALPALAFAILGKRHFPYGWLARVASVTTVTVVVLLVFATGTRQPGAVIFDPIYSLPYGWLLQTPGRFLLLAGLGYGVLVASLIDSISRAKGHAPYLQRRRLWGLRGNRLARTFGAAAGLLVAGSSGYPLLTGSVIPGAIGHFPSHHVTVPRYWQATFAHLNRQRRQRTLLVLPPDDFYQMPYRWYYGTDGFIVDALDRHVIVPNAQQYAPATGELMAAVNLEASALLGRQYALAHSILRVLGANDVLVRGDIVANFPGRTIVSPAALVRALAGDPYMVRTWHSGLLYVYSTRKPFPRRFRGFATISGKTPNLRALSLAGGDRALVSSQPISGHESILQLPRLTEWTMSGNRLSTSEVLPVGWRYHPAVVSGDRRRVKSSVGLVWHRGSHTMEVSVRLGKSVIVDGNFAHGPWQRSVGNCSDVTPAGAGALTARVIPAGAPRGAAALMLSATIDSACEAQRLQWRAGSVRLSMKVRSLRGANVRFCVLEVPTQQCAALPQPVQGRRWHSYSATLNPLPHTRQLYLFLYADSFYGGRSVEEYADVTVRSMPRVPTIMLVGKSKTSSSAVRLVTAPTEYSAGWHARGRHVRVDGLINGWLVRRGVSVSGPILVPVKNETRDEVLLAAGGMCAAFVIGWLLLGGRLRRRSASAASS